jgi:polar amino acid transport system ATP-binding protein
MSDLTTGATDRTHPVLHVEGLRKTYDDKVVLAGVDLVVVAHDVVCLIGA